MKLRDYQQDAIIHFFNTQENFLYCFPTGTGKSIIITTIVKKLLQTDKIVGVVVPSIELLNNLYDYFLTIIDRRKIQLMSDKVISLDKKLYLGVYKSFENKKYLLPKLDLLLHDECHHTASKTWFNLMTSFSKTRNVGFSATPFRLDGKPLPFTDIYEPYPISWYMDNGYLCNDIVEYIGEKLIIDSTDYEDLNKQWEQAKSYTHGEFLRDWEKFSNGKTIIYATNIQHCSLLKEQYEKVVPTEILHSKMSMSKRKEIFDDFEKGKIQVLINVNVLIEGINVPDATTIQFARFFGNVGSYTQAVGRVLRPLPGKKVVIIDNAGNLTHGSVRYLSGWKELFYESFKYEQREEIINEFKRLALPVPKFLFNKPTSSENLVKYSLTKFQDALVKSLKKRSGSQMINFWTAYIKQNKNVTSEEFAEIIKVCETVMSPVKARRILSDLF